LIEPVSRAPAPDRRLLRVIRGERMDTPPIWIMRQDGRYLPEYRAIRQRAKDFLELCYTPELAAEVTLQPLRRFPLDAAILFSDILVIPDALGQQVRFEAGEGPVLEPLDAAGIERLQPGEAMARLGPVLETVRLVRAALPADKTLLGFCGAPWTVATYMIGGRGSSDQAAARLFALSEPAAFGRLIEVLVEASIGYLGAQLEAGADAVQLFESWASNLDEVEFRRWVIAPARRIVEGLRRRVPGAAVIGFPRGAAGLLPAYAAETGIDMVGLDQAVPLEFAARMLPPGMPVQGNLDPLRLVAGGPGMEARAREIMDAFSGRPHVFNLGHGIVPQTPIEHVEQLVRLVRGE
jgi:uroporphyrinogen decarboxylase